MKRLFILGLLSVLLGACDDFLEKSPSKNANFEIETVEQLEALLSDNNNEYIEHCLAPWYCTDCFELPPEYYVNGFNFILTSLEGVWLGVWEMKHLENVNVKTSQWLKQFEGIYLANLILNSLDDVSGSEEAKATIRAKAHLLRAYNYLDLVNYYCMPYGNSTLNEPGLPLKRSTGYEENVRRASLQETYDFIESDVLEALKLKTPLWEDGVRKQWRENGGLANALAARFYLTKEDYVLALKYATEALEYGNDLLDYNTVDCSLLPFFGMSGFGLISEGIDIGNQERAYYCRYNTCLNNMLWAIPSERLINLYNHEYDLRYKYFVSESYQKVFMGGAFKDLFFMDVRGYGMYDMGMALFNTPNVAEMLLIRAECLARMGQVAEAMQVLNDFRVYRLASDTPESVAKKNTSSQQEAVRFVLEERMMEFPFTLRWYDIRRCNFNNDPSDDVTVTKTFYPLSAYDVETSLEPKVYTLSPTTRNYAVAIPITEIVASDGVIEQNRY